MIIRTAIPEDIIAIKDITDLQLGKDYLTLSRIDAQLKDRGNSIFIAEEKGELSGFLISRAGIGNEIIAIIGNSYAQKLSVLSNKKKASMLKTMAVHPVKNGLGIGTGLLHRWMLECNNYHILISLNWYTHGEEPLNKMLKKEGFKAYVLLKNYWKKASLEENFNCPECGSPPCRCNAMIFIKNQFN